MEYVELVVRSRDGDMDAYGELVKAYQNMAFGYAYSLLGDFHLAEDASQEAFIEGFRGVADIREPGAWPGWLRRIVHRQCLRARSRRQPFTEPLESVGELPSGDRSPDDAAVDAETHGRIAAALRGLSPQERTAALMYYTGGYRQREIAEFLGTTTHVIKHRLRSARQKLRHKVAGGAADSLGDALGDTLGGTRGDSVGAALGDALADLTASAPSQDGAYRDAVIQRISRETRAGLAMPALSTPAFGPRGV